MNSVCSVIVPTRNRQDRLLKTLSTIRAQSHQPLEIIISDDGSNDETVRMVQQLGDDRITVVTSERNNGVAEARNRGIEQSNGDWVAFCDDDDLWNSDKLAQQIQITQRSGRRWSFCFAIDVDDDLRYISTQGRDPGSDPYRRLLFGDNIVPGGCSTVVVRRDLLDEIGGFDHRLSMLADLDLWIRLASKGPPAVSPYHHVAYVHHGQQMSLDMRRVRTELALMRSKNSAPRSGYRRPSYEPIDAWIVQRSWIGGDRLGALTHAVSGPGPLLWFYGARTIASAVSRNLLGYRRTAGPDDLAALDAIQRTLDDEQPPHVAPTIDLNQQLPRPVDPVRAEA